MRVRSPRLLASASIIAMLTASMLSFHALGIDPQYALPDTLTEVLEFGSNDGRYSTGMIPVRIALLLPMGFGLLAIRPAGLPAVLRSQPMLLVSALLCWLLLIIPVANRPGMSLFGTLTLIGSLLFVVWFVREFELSALLRTISVFTIALVNGGFVWWAITGTGFTDERFDGISLAASHFGEAAGLVFVILLIAGRGLFSPMVRWTACATVGAALVLTGTRSAMAGAALALCFAALRSPRTLWLFIAVSLAITPVVLWTDLADPALGIVSRNETDQFTLSERTEVWEFVWRDASQFLVTGTGYGNGAGGQADYLFDLARDEAFDRPIVYAHNYLFSTYLSSGLIGLLLVIAIPFAYARTARRFPDLSLDTIVVYLFGTATAENVLLESPIRVSSMVLVGILTHRALQGLPADNQRPSAAGLAAEPTRTRLPTA